MSPCSSTDGLSFAAILNFGFGYNSRSLSERENKTHKYFSVIHNNRVGNKVCSMLCSQKRKKKNHKTRHGRRRKVRGTGHLFFTRFNLEDEMDDFSSFLSLLCIPSKPIFHHNHIFLISSSIFLSLTSTSVYQSISSVFPGGLVYQHGYTELLTSTCRIGSSPNHVYHQKFEYFKFFKKEFTGNAMYLSVLTIILHQNLHFGKGVME